MKKFFLVLTIIFGVLILTGNVQAQSPTASTNPTEDEQQIEKIKDIVASRVAELNLVEKKGVLGTVFSNSSTQITLEDIAGDKRIIEIDEITKFNDPDNDDFGVSDIEEGQTIGVIGLLNKAADRILARYINVVNSVPEYFDGIVTEIDKKNFQAIAVDESGDERKIDIVTSTKTSLFTKEDGFIKSGFSKIAVGERIFAAGFTDSKDDTQLNATRVIHFPDLSPSEKMKMHITSPEKKLE